MTKGRRGGEQVREEEEQAAESVHEKNMSTQRNRARKQTKACAFPVLSITLHSIVNTCICGQHERRGDLWDAILNKLNSMALFD